MEQEIQILHAYALEALCKHSVLKPCEKHPDQYLPGSLYFDIDAQAHALIELWKLNPSRNTAVLTKILFSRRRMHAINHCTLCQASAGDS